MVCGSPVPLVKVLCEGATIRDFCWRGIQITAEVFCAIIPFRRTRMLLHLRRSISLKGLVPWSERPVLHDIRLVSTNESLTLRRSLWSGLQGLRQSSNDTRESMPGRHPVRWSEQRSWASVSKALTSLDSRARMSGLAYAASTLLPCRLRMKARATAVHGETQSSYQASIILGLDTSVNAMHSHSPANGAKGD